MDKQYDQRIRRTRRKPGSRNTHRFTQNDTKKYHIGRRKAMIETWFLVKEIHLHSRQTSTRNEQMPTKGTRTRMDNQKRTTLIQKDSRKGTAINNYWHITYQPTMWNILTAQIIEEIYSSLTSRGLFPDEQKVCCKGTRGRAVLLNIDQHILNESKTIRKNLTMAWVDYKKAYDMVP